MQDLKLICQEKPAFSLVELAGQPDFLLIAGPCSIESQEQLLTTAQAVKAAGANFLRGGAYKPRTSPYAFQGLGQTGLEYLREASQLTGLPVITEVLDPRDVETVSNYADILQIGTRSMQNFPLLIEAGRSQKPVLLKRGLSATLQEWLSAAEYILQTGNQKLLLCERGIRTIENYTRNTLDLSAVAALKELTAYPIIVDPSHATGRWSLIKPMSLAAVMAGCDGLMLEVHPNPSQAWSDGEQQLTLTNFAQIARQIHQTVAFRQSMLKN
ncbi:MAG: 3-deoxy-7-phosphoheptulonate synthase [Clostridia bacterium]|nr:3-deoxy-7-phosphoheptulonate synthase [Clostridia bacterium]